MEAVTPGSSVTLSCTIDANPIDLSKIRWYKNSEDLSSISNGVRWERRVEGNEVSLIGRSVYKEDAGQYACEIDNPYGSDRGTMPLVVQCKFVLSSILNCECI